MTWLVLDRRPIVRRLAGWFPDDVQNMVVFTEHGFRYTEVEASTSPFRP